MRRELQSVDRTCILRLILVLALLSSYAVAGERSNTQEQAQWSELASRIQMLSQTRDISYNAVAEALGISLQNCHSGKQAYRLNCGTPTNLPFISVSMDETSLKRGDAVKGIAVYFRPIHHNQVLLAEIVNAFPGWKRARFEHDEGHAPLTFPSCLKGLAAPAKKLIGVKVFLLARIGKKSCLEALDELNLIVTAI
jgi:hypothetical protein